jgi:UDP-GlcNAc3NAcA epimerase
MFIKVATIVGARPQFIKAEAVSRVIRNNHSGRIAEVLIHTGQHYDENLSRVFFEELDLPQPNYQLGIAGGLHGEMTGQMLAAIEQVLLAERPDWVLVYGDTNSTLAGALAAVKLNIPVAHVEAGLRSFNMRMPEEINRILTDRVSTLLFCPTPTGVKNLNAEGIVKGVYNVGDVMYDAALYYRDRATKTSNILDRLSLRPGKFALATCHRAENTDDPIRLREICLGLSEVGSILPVVFPIHPRTRRLIAENGLQHHLLHITAVDPVPFFDMVALEQAARLILTDSGGVQKEAFFFGVPCITMRDETEWVETVDSGANRLAGANRDRIHAAACGFLAQKIRIDALPHVYGTGKAGADVLTHLIHHTRE